MSGALQSISGAARSKKIYNSQVFNLSECEELNQYNQVMRRYGDRLVCSPPERYFSSKTESLHVFIDWMSEYTFEEEFLGEDAPDGPPEIDDADSDPTGESALSRLAARIQAAKMPHPTDAEKPTDDPGDAEQS